MNRGQVVSERIGSEERAVTQVVGPMAATSRYCWAGGAAQLLSRYELSDPQERPHADWLRLGERL